MTERVSGARIGSIGAGPGTVVGQGEIHLAVVRVDRAPFRAIHLGGANHVSCQASIDQYLTLVGKTHSSSLAGLLEFLVVDIQRQPFTLAAGVEARDIQCAFVEQAAIAAPWAVFVAADVFVDVLVL